MRILIATGLFPPDIGGPATYSKMLLEELPKRGIPTEVLPFGAVRDLPKFIRHVSYFFSVLRSGRRADVIYAQDPVSVGLPAFLAARLLRKPFILKVVGDYAWEQGVQRFGVVSSLDEFVRTRGGPISVRVLWSIERFVARGAKRVIVPSEYLKKIVVSWGVSSKRIVIIYNAFERASHFESKAALREKLELRGATLISVGRLVPWKGFAELIRLAGDLRSEVRDLKLLIVGDGPEREALKNVIAEERLEDTVELLGRLPQSVLMNYIKASDLFVLNTSYEGFSHQLLEVMDAGTPIVTTAVGGNGELVENGVSGLLVPPNDAAALRAAILRLLSDTKLRWALTDGGERRAQDFSRERMVGELLELLNRI